MATRGSGASSGSGAAPPRWGTPAVRAAIIGTGLIGLVLRVWILLRPGLMSVTQYDDGPYFGSAVRLVHSVLPYRDYAFVQPPGITLLMSPAALESYLGGTAWALVMGRILTVLAGAAAVVLTGFLVRHRGALAVWLTAGLLAIYPAAAQSSHTVLLEPWLLLFCLAGAVAVFDRDRMTASTRRLAWGGVAFGFAGAIKVWAIVPVIVLAALCLPRLKRAAVFAGGVAAGFLIPVVPFALNSPGRFVDDVVVAQLARIGAGLPAWMRLNSMIGTPTSLTSGTVISLAIIVLVFVVVAQLAAWWVTRRPPAPLDWFALASAAVIVPMFLWPPYYSSHYATFLGPFLALSAGLPVARLACGLASRPPAQLPMSPSSQATAGGPQATEPGTPPTSPSPLHRRPWLARTGLVLLGLAVLAGAVAQVHPPEHWTDRFAAPTVTLRLIPRGACVLTDSPAYVLIANRFTSDVPGCSQMVDSLGTDLALGAGRRPGYGAGRVPAVVAAWRQAFRTADWVLLTPKNPKRIPWNDALHEYFRRHFGFVRHEDTAKHQDTYNLYARDGVGPTGPSRRAAL